MKSIKMLMMAALTILFVSVFAQDSTKQKTKTTKEKSEKVTYSCPMHPGETSNKAGKCSICKMELKENVKTSKSYSCSMHPEITSDKPGKCAKCGMDLSLSPKEKMKTYTCPMHTDITSDKPGKCSKCNMDLKEKKEDHSNHQH